MTSLSQAQLEHDPDGRMVLGSSGLKHHSGIIDEEFLHRLRGRNGIKLYNEMRNNSSIIAAALNVISLLIRQVEWRIEPANESDPAKAEAEDTESALEDMSHTFEDFISEALSFLWAGYSPFEIVYKLRKGPDQEDPRLRSKFNDGKWGWRKIEIRAQETIYQWVFDHEGGLDGFIQQNIYATGSTGMQGPVFIPIEKALLFRTETFKGNPEGKSFLRPAVIPYWYTKRIQEFEAIGAERNLAGMPMMEVPPELLLEDASPGDKALRIELEQFITQIRMDERWGGLVPSSTKPDGSPSGYKFQLVQNSGRRTVDTDLVIRRYESRMLMMFMAQFLLMGMDSVGSFSLSSNMTSMFGVAIGTVMDQIASVINRFLIPRRQRLNNVDPRLDPFMTHGDLEGPQLDKVGAYINQLAASGMITSSKPLERKLLEIGNLPQPPDEEDADLPLALRERTVEDVGRSSLSSEQVRTVLDINKALKNKELDHETAIAMVAAALGIDDEQAKVLVPAPLESVEPAPNVPNVPNAPDAPNAPGVEIEDE